MAFIESPRFPACPSFGYTASPNYSVTIARTASGREFRNRNWARPLLRFECTVGPRAEDEIQELLEFWHAMGGSECGFRFKDFSDFKSTRANSAVTPIDQTLEWQDDSPSGYQLMKAYTFGTRSQLRPIYKPVEGTVRIANNGVEIVEGAQWDLDYSNGLLTLNVVPNGPITWGGEFDVPVRFDSDFPIEILNRGATQMLESVSFALQELRNPLSEA